MLCKKERKRELRCVATKVTFIYLYLYIMSLVTRRMIALLTTLKILHKRRIKGLVYWTLTSVIFIGPGLPGFLGRGLCVYNYVFGKMMVGQRRWPSEKPSCGGVF